MKVNPSVRLSYHINIVCPKCSKRHSHRLNMTMADEMEYTNQVAINPDYNENIYDQKVMEWLETNSDKVVCWDCRNRKAYMRKYMKARRAKNPRKLHEKECTICGKDFVSKRSDAIYCSTSCRVKKARGQPYLSVWNKRNTI